MSDKTIRFNFFRYHLLPLDQKDNENQLFPEKKLSVQEIKEKKNIFFAEVLQSLENSKANTNPVKLEDQDGDFYLFKIANKKFIERSKNFKIEILEDEPFVYVLINNNDNVQKIGISENSDAFTSVAVVKNILKKVFQKELAKFDLNIEIEQIFNSFSFWEYVEKVNHKITYLNFEFVKPNMARISRVLPEAFKSAAEKVNSHESHLTFKAPEKGTLKNIDKNNGVLNGLVNYSAEGGGEIKMKIKGIRKYVKTSDNPSFLEIKEIELEGHTEQLLKVYQTLIE